MQSWSQAKLFLPRDWFSSACYYVRNLHFWKIFLTQEQLRPLVWLCSAYPLLARQIAPRTWQTTGCQFQSASVISEALWLMISDISQLSPAPPQVHAITAPYAGSQALILSPGVLSPPSCRVGHYEATSGGVDTVKLPGGNSPYFIPCAAVACERVWWSEDKDHAGNRANILFIWKPPGLCPGPTYSPNQTWPKWPSFSKLCRENISLMHHRRQTLTLGV